jgi:hypothetical protein
MNKNSSMEEMGAKIGALMHVATQNSSDFEVLREVYEDIGLDDLSTMFDVICTLCKKSVVDTVHVLSCRRCILEYNTPDDLDGGIVATNSKTYAWLDSKWTRKQIDAVAMIRNRSDIYCNPDIGGECLIIRGVVKNFCSTCNLYINPVAHEERCNNKVTPIADVKRTSKSWTAQRTAAWIGDTYHRLDLQYLALKRNIDDVERESWVNNYSSRVGQAAYMARFEYENNPLDGCSISRVSEVFESLYKGEFRAKYLKTLFGNVAREEIVSQSQFYWIPEFIRDAETGRVNIKTI